MPGQVYCLQQYYLLSLKRSGFDSSEGLGRVWRDAGELLAVEYCCHTKNEDIKNFRAVSSKQVH